MPPGVRGHKVKAALGNSFPNDTPCCALVKESMETKNEWIFWLPPAAQTKGEAVDLDKALPHAGA